MKKLVTAICALATAAAIAQVESANVVGFIERPATGYTIFNPGFQKVGGGETIINDIIDTSKLMAYVDEIQVYNPEDGLTYPYYWDGASQWTDYFTSIDVDVVPGATYFANFIGNIKVCGEVVNSETLRYNHNVPLGYSLFGSAFPVAIKASNFNFGEVMMNYVDEVQVYNPDDGLTYPYYWDGKGFTDYFEYLPDEIAPIGEGVFIGNNSAFTGLVEDINPKAE